MQVPEASSAPRTVEFVVKVSKFCNLRCKYCYEFEQLGDRERMPLADLERFYRNVATWYGGFETPTIVDFVWHGGEPLVTPPSYFERTFEDQRTIFDGVVIVRNTIQTNLTVLDQERIDLLRCFDRVGVSIDLYGELRTDLRGRDSVRRVLQNMDRLHANGIEFGCITVLSGRNASSVRKIVEFYHRLGVSSVRLLPLIDGASADQHSAFDITPAGVVAALQEAFEKMVELNSGLIVEPISGYVREVVHHHTPGAARMIYDKGSWETVYLVDTNGDLFSYGNAYDPEFCHGNVFQSAMEHIVLSPGHRRAIETAETRMTSVCTSCRFFGSCSGYPMAEEAPLQRRQGAPLACDVDRPMLEYIERRLREMGAVDRDGKSLVSGSTWPSHVRPARLSLQRGVLIHSDVPDGLPFQDRVNVSAGTTNRTVPPDDGLQYISAAFVPRSPFRPATRYETGLLAAQDESPWRIGNDIAIVRIPDDVIAPLMQVFEDFGTSQSLENYRDHTSHPAWADSYARLSGYIAHRHSMDGDEPRVVRLGNSPPGKVTVTKDTVQGRPGVHYVGLHIDSWTDVALHLREYSQNRICINVGRSDRHFLFINLSLARMNAILHGTELADTDYYGSDLGHDFMRAFPDYPVVRLAIRPGEAYIAPTENLIHDGSSLGMAGPDLALHMIGALAPRRAVELRTSQRSARGSLGE